MSQGAVGGRDWVCPRDTVDTSQGRDRSGRLGGKGVLILSLELWALTEGY